MIEQLKAVEVHLERRTNEQGHLFGSVTATDIAKQLQAQNFNVVAEDINLPGRIGSRERLRREDQVCGGYITDVKIWGFTPMPTAKPRWRLLTRPRPSRTRPKPKWWPGW